MKKTAGIFAVVVLVAMTAMPVFANTVHKVTIIENPKTETGAKFVPQTVDTKANTASQPISETKIDVNKKNGLVAESDGTYFYENDTRLSGFHAAGTSWHYFAKDTKKMVTGKQVINDCVYNFNDNGQMIVNMESGMVVAPGLAGGPANGNSYSAR